MNTPRYDLSFTFWLYLLAGTLFGIYGGRVCPMLETLTLSEVLIHTGITFTALFAARHIISSRLEYLGFSNLAKLDAGLFLIASIPLAMFYSLSYEFPIDSNLKVVFGLTMFGFLTGFILNLRAQLENVEQFDQDSSPITLQTDERQSMMGQAIALVLLLLVTLTITLSMVALKDVFWLEHNPERVLDGSGKISIIKEFAYIASVFIGYSIYIMKLWRQLMKRILADQETALKKVAAGHIDTRLPIYNNDEFGAVARMTNAMIDTLQDSQDEVAVTRDVAIVSLSALAESRDNETGAHILRTQEYVKALAIELSAHPKHSTLLSPSYIDLLYKSAPLHDIGKVGVPDDVLLKPGKLTDEEFDIMKSHPVIGAEALSIAEQQLGSSSFLRVAKEISLTHHEKWDGSGYPKGLAKDDIPLSGRLMALADVYDALISKRVYKPAFSHDKAKAIIVEGRGQHFDPEVVDAFLAVEQQFIDIAKQYKDKEHEIAA